MYTAKQKVFISLRSGKIFYDGVLISQQHRIWCTHCLELLEAHFM